MKYSPIKSNNSNHRNRVGTTLYVYDYDSFGQLIYERDYIQNLSRRYDFDEGGNLWSETVNYYDGSNGGVPTRSETINYGYSDSNWTDKMTSYNGQTITYDEIGNPLSYRDGMTMTWQNGRQLASLQKGNNNIQYSYDSEGIRVSKTINGEKCTFEYLNGMLLYETRGEKFFHYYYDSNGTLYAVDYKLSSADTSTRVYYFTHNWRGDIVGIYNGNGDLRAKYEYDSWGNVISITDCNGNAITDQNHIANLNPFRYRGYYMDTETGMYYLMSRYYDPVTHRFLNADGYFQTGLGVLDGNMNAYCQNNPVNYFDPSGTRCHAQDGGRFSPLCPVDWKTGYCNVCKKQDCCLPSNSIVVNQGVHLKNIKGTPNSRIYDNDGNWRQFGDDGMAKYDYHSTDHGNELKHPHGFLNPNGEHMHKWGYNDKGVFDDGPPLPWQGSEEETLKQGSNHISWDYTPSFDFDFDFDFDFKGIPNTGQKPIYEQFWDDLVHLFE